MVATRAVDALTAVDHPAWPRLKRLVDRSPVPVTVLPVERAVGERTLHRLQVTAASTLGALALETGGLLVDHGWLRLLGGGPGPLPDLAEANRLDEPDPGEPVQPGALTVAFDVLGGRFAVNGGDLPGRPGEVCYWGPDTLEWTPIGVGHTAFVDWALAGKLDSFYADLRWPGWQREVAAVDAADGLACYPFLFSAEGRDITETVRSAVPFEELLLLLDDLARQVGYLPSAPAIRLSARSPRMR